MDNYLAKHRHQHYYNAIAQAEANTLTRKANFIAHSHLNHPLVRLDFNNEIQAFIKAQFDVISRTSDDNICQQCIQNIKAEIDYLDTQDRLLRSGNAAIHASISVIKDKDNWGYIINGIGVVLGGLQVVAGLAVISASLASGVVIGTAFGGMLVLHGLNGVQESAENLIFNKSDSIGFLKKGYIVTAKFLGFDSKVGQIAYSSMDLALSLYGFVRLIKKPEAWRLFYYLNTDYVRKIKEMSRNELLIEIYNDGIAIKSIRDSYNK
ncbi:hypothetical protein LG71_09570 [Pluralibacter gergoviae]|uniref:DUF4225 domain-containing protein n=1 Tax=Pluralibacter gergoviae TaxID=61647 RepID=UPI0004F783FB|nr:DUF4225 domain-containing protein [Pluralibacter gergoviae]AIR00129.1 hypothetical protein LG71_09570 [Pluralibacter gergoviae]